MVSLIVQKYAINSRKKHVIVRKKNEKTFP
jgi:hypothetical protein